MLQQTRPESVLAPQTVVAAHPGMKQWLTGALAREAGPAGIVANLEVILPSTWLDRVAGERLGAQAVKLPAWQRAHLRWTLHDLLRPGHAVPGLEDARIERYLAPAPGAAAADAARRRFQLADRLAGLYSQYLVYRPDWLDAWEHGQYRFATARQADVDLQRLESALLAPLWRALKERLGPHRADAVDALVVALQSPTPCEPLHVFGVVAIIVLGKALAAVGLVLVLRYPLNTALTVAASLAQIGEFSFILAALGVSLKILPPDGRDLILAGSLLSIIANPFLFSWLDRWQKKQDALAPVPAEPEVPPGPSLDVTDHAIIIGYGRVGSELARVLRDRGVPLIVIDDNGDHVARAHDAGIPAIRGSAAADRVLAEAHPERAKIAVLAIPQPLEAGEALAKLRAINPALTLLARAHSEGEVKHLLEHGADGAVLAERELAFSLAEMVMSTPPYRPQRVTG